MHSGHVNFRGKSEFTLYCFQITAIYTVCGKMEPPYFALELYRMLTDFQNSFTDRLSSKFLLTKLLNIPSHLKRVDTLPCEIVVFENRNDPKLCEENCHSRLSHSKHLLKNIYPVTLASFLFTDEKIFIVAEPNSP